LGQEFLLNFKRSSLDLGVPLGVSGYFAFPARSSLALRHYGEETPEDSSSDIIALPPYQTVNASLGVTIRARRSRREFTGQTFSLQTLSTILFYGNGLTGNMALVSEEDDPQWPQYALGAPSPAQTRAASSGGGLNPVSLYHVIHNVESLDDGKYLYLPYSHSLKKVTEVDDNKRQEHLTLGVSWGPNVDPANVSVTIYYVYNINENSRKYGDLGLLFGLIEAGHIAAHIHLIWEKVQTERFLGLDGLSKQLVHTTVLGRV
jgi:SagB-type dehydrogenase family enzyme